MSLWNLFLAAGWFYILDAFGDFAQKGGALILIILI